MRFSLSESLLLGVDPDAVEVCIYDFAAKLLKPKEKLEEILLHQFMDESVE